MFQKRVATIPQILQLIQNLRFDVESLKSDFEQIKIALNKSTDSTNRMIGNLDLMAGEFKKFDEEQTILSYRQSDHTDRLEKLEEKVFGVATAS